jgi:hypothetical protein
MKPFVSIVLLLIWNYAFSQFQTISSGNWNNPSTWLGNNIPNSPNDDVEICNGYTITLNTNVSVRNITITQGSLILGNNRIAIYGNVLGPNKNNFVSNSNTELQVLGGYDVPQFIMPLQVQKLKKLVINRKQGIFSNHSIDLDDGVPADGIVLVLQLGILYMENESIVYLNSKQIQSNIPCSDSSHIDGIVQRNIPKNAGIYTFPVGNKGFCRPFGVGLQNGNSDNINQVRFLYETPIQNTNINYNNLPGGIIQYFYWKHTVISGANPQRRLQYSYDDFPGISSQERIQSMTLANTNGTSAWDKATTPWSVYDDSLWVQFNNANASNNEYWTLGSINSEVKYENIKLPIELVDFWSRLITNNKIELHWTTAQEINNSYFVIFRSINGTDFMPIDTVEAKGNSRDFTYYEYLDYIEQSADSILYYKLKQVDMNGSSSESHIIEVFIPYTQTVAENIFECKPLPGYIELHIDIQQNPITNIIISNTQGLMQYSCNSFNSVPFFSKQIQVSGNSYYIIYIQQGNKITTKKMFVQSL